jgi:hypothetical protein
MNIHKEVLCACYLICDQKDEVELCCCYCIACYGAETSTTKQCKFCQHFFCLEDHYSIDENLCFHCFYQQKGG